MTKSMNTNSIYRFSFCARFLGLRILKTTFEDEFLSRVETWAIDWYITNIKKRARYLLKA